MKVNNSVSAISYPVSPLSQSFDATIKRYRISAKRLSGETKVSENHISEFRRGKCDVSTTTLSKLLDGMEVLAPGSKQFFYQLVLDQENQSSTSFKRSLVEVIQTADEDELLDAMSEITNRFRSLRSFTDVPSAQSLMNVNNCA
ncbi:helix-turn-helix transcriptional regulator [Anabaena sp. PCC 7108]|uniref:helix-turn-helix domain-containing protein n=1 Tax=Anabaena sp. PCC 7108 TaxID=163908 RepID=UPI000A077F5C|nr:helix-turn-helix transcriptional regulator [Anabaena sp. PCC 7108]